MTRHGQPLLRKEWSSQRKAAQARDVERDIAPPNVRTIAFCPICAGDIVGPVYGAYFQGTKRWDGICSACAAEWTRHGGRVAIRWIR